MNLLAHRRYCKVEPISLSSLVNRNTYPQIYYTDDILQISTIIVIDAVKVGTLYQFYQPCRWY